jgi:glucosylceramidase
VALWNLALDPQGGPVQAPNTACTGCTGVVTVDERTHQVSFGAPYFQLGQVSKFLQPGAVRIYSNHFVKYSAAGPGAGLDDVAFRNPDGTEALVAYNNSSAPVRFAVVWHDQSFSYKLPAGAMVTFSWRSTGLSGE